MNSAHGGGAGARIGGLRLTHSQLGLPIALANGGLQHALSGWCQEPGSGSNVYLEQMPGGRSGLQPSGVTPAGSVPDEDVQCIRISNTAESEMTVLRYEELIPVREGDHYSMQTALSLEAPLSGGIRAEVRFLNAAKQPLGPELLSPTFNRPTLTNWVYQLESTGADANMYMISGESRFAEQAKQKLLYMLADMQVGMDIFRRDGWHDDDTYGAVHIGRGLAAASVIYDQIAGSSVLLPEEESQLLAHFRYIAAMMMDTGYYRFDLETFPDEKGANAATGMRTGRPGWACMPSSSRRRNRAEPILIMPSLSSTGSSRKWWTQTALGRRTSATTGPCCTAIFSFSSC
ncbi:hypothetical protein [Paenibacillus sp. P32E]|uniref:hypothetical protein n=1 Tax=Paenibacillus sp. P32E TaxID=1349434 RepID=UPI00093FCC3A|nr:hypothetical protein [Paenibacillus sp. P32E]OKP83117.1 hypothetical protein A3848_27825 [Paenibacillus sp. P32E]